MDIHPWLFNVVDNTYEEGDDGLDGITPEMIVFFFGPHSTVTGLSRFAASTRMKPDANNTISAIDDGWLVALTFWLCIMERAWHDLPPEHSEQANVELCGCWRLWLYGDGFTYRDGERTYDSVSVFGVLRENAAQR